MRATVLSACLLLARPAAHAADPWETKDTVLLGGALGVLAIDWAQTRKVTRAVVERQFTNASLNPFETMEVTRRQQLETNPLLGHEPSSAEINRYFIVAMAGTALAAYAMPARYRRLFLGGVLIIESAVVIHNHRIGLGWAF